MPINDLLAAKLKANTVHFADIVEADNILQAEGYQFIGYHGCHQASLSNIVPYNFDPRFSGKGEGNSKGKGFYLSFQRSLSKEYADSATQAGDPIPDPMNPKMNVIPRHPGERGISKVVRIYVRNFDCMHLGVDFTWGVQCSDKDPNNDKTIKNKNGQNYQQLAHDLELVFRFDSYPDLAAIPAPRSFIDQLLTSQSRLAPQIIWPPLKLDDTNNPFAITAENEKNAAVPFEFLSKPEQIDILNKPLIFSVNASSSTPSAALPLPNSGPGIRRTRSN